MNKIILSIIFVFCFVGVAFCAPANMYVTTTGAGDKTGADWANAFSYAEFETDYEGSQEAGDKYFFMEGAYTITSGLNATADGTASLPVQIIGVVSGTTAEPPTMADWAYGSDRPTFSTGANDYRISPKDYTVIANIILNTGAFQGISLDLASTLYNVKISSSNAVSTGECINLAESGLRVIASEMTAPSGANITITSQWGTTYVGNYFHDSLQCGEIGAYSFAANNIFDSCTTGLKLEDPTSTVIGNTFYNNTTGLNLDGGGAFDVFNNLFDSNTTGASNTSAVPGVIFDYNVWSNNTTDVSNITKGSHDVTANISLTDPSKGDFTLPDSSGAEGIAIPVGANVGLTGDYNWNIGVDQTDTQGGEVSYGYAN